MNKTLSFKGVEELMGRIEPGIDEVEITGVEDGENDNGKYYLSIKLVSLDKKREHDEKFYFTTEKGQKISLSRLRSLIKELLGEAAVADDKEYSVEQLNKLLTGQKFRGKFVGEEYEYDDQVRIRTSFAFSGFAENMSVPAEESKLSFNPNKDIKRLAIAPSAMDATTAPKNELFD